MTDRPSRSSNPTIAFQTPTAITEAVEHIRRKRYVLPAILRESARMHQRLASLLRSS